MDEVIMTTAHAKVNENIEPRLKHTHATSSTLRKLYHLLTVAERILNHWR
jgi:hypothetical protein